MGVYCYAQIKVVNIKRIYLTKIYILVKLTLNTHT
jgi:hypothetical protein